MREELIFLGHNDISKVSHCKFCGKELVPHVTFEQDTGKIEYTQWKLCPTENILYKIFTANDSIEMEKDFARRLSKMPFGI